MLKQLAITALFGGLVSFGAHAQVAALNEGFEGAAIPTGWVTTNLSTRASTGNPWGVGTGITDADGNVVVPPHAGSGMAVVNYSSVGSGSGTISNWLISPELQFGANGTLTFYTTTTPGSEYPDRLEVRLSTSAGSTDVGTSTTSVGVFTTLLTTINSGLVVGEYPESWTLYTLTGLPTSGTGRVAFRYYVTSGGPSGTNSNIIGLDDVGYVSDALTAQVITNFSAIPATPQFATDATFAVSASGGGSGNPVIFTLASSSSGICTISGSTVTITAAGTCTVLADQAGSAGFASAPQASLPVTIAPASTTLSIAAPTTIAYGQTIDVGASVTITATGATIASGVVDVSDGTVSCSFDLSTATDCNLAPTSPGPKTLTVSYVGGGNFAASSASASVDVIPHTAAGALSGLVGSGLRLHLDPGAGGTGEDAAPFGGATTFAFTTPIAFGATYAVTVTEQPSGPLQTCTVANGSGTMPAADVSDILVTCTTNAYAIDVTASGIDASGLVLQLNGGNDLAVNANGTFAFGANIDSGAAYTVTILTQPAGRSCSLTNASGTVGGEDVSVGVNCVALPQLALFASDNRDFARYGQIVDTIVTLANNGDGDAADVLVAFTLSADFDGDYAQWACFNAGNGASCTQDGGNRLLYHVALPAHRSLTWLVSVPVRADAPDASVDFSVSADGAVSVTDTDTLVIFRDGFDVPYGDGTQAVPTIEGAQATSLRH